MPRYAPNKMSLDVKRRYFQLIRQGIRGARAAAEVGVSLSCGSVWFIDAGSVSYVETPISGRYLSQDDRIEIADGIERGERAKAIAARIGKSYQTVYREIARNRKPDGRYQPWYAHNQAHLRRRRPKTRRLQADPALREAVAGKLRCAWSPAQISRWLRRRYPRRRGWHLCAETIYEGVYRGLVLQADPANLRTGRTYRRRRGRGRSRDGALKQSTNIKSIRDRPAAAETRVVEHGATLGIDVEVVTKDPQVKGFSVIKRRWVVERTIGWLMHHRRLVRDYETRPHNSASMITLAMIDNLTKRATDETTITWRDTPNTDNSQTT